MQKVRMKTGVDAKADVVLVCHRGKPDPILPVHSPRPRRSGPCEVHKWGEVLSFYRRMRKTRARRRFLRELAASGDFDKNWYRTRYPDVSPDVDPLEHFVDFGWREGRFPNPIFDTIWYLDKYSDVAKSGVNPLAHYVKHGAAEGRNPNLWFDAAYYKEAVGGDFSGLSPVAHYLKQRPERRITPSREFDALEYRRWFTDGADVPDDLFCDFLHNPEFATQGWLGDLTSTYITGWACRNSGAALRLTVRVNGVHRGDFNPWLRRPDVKAAGFGLISGYFFSFQRRLSKGDIVEVVDERGAQLHGSPRAYEVAALAPEIGFIRVRAAIAQTFLRGHGLEIGAFTQPTDVPDHVTVDYYDKFPPPVLRGLYDENWGRPLVEPKYYGDAQTLAGVPFDIRFDFVIANHVIEHLEDPIQFLKTLANFLKPGGRAFLSAPNKKFTFDQGRELTPFEHIARDHRDGVAMSRKAHYEEWVERVDGLTGDAAAKRAALLDREDFSIHFHVWDEGAFYQFLVSAIDRLQIPFTAIFLFNANHEIVVILQRNDEVAAS